MADYGIKISKPGYDVKSLDVNLDNSNLSFTSKYDVLKIAKTGTGTFNTGSSATIAHNLGYPAAFIVYLSTDGTNYYTYDGRSYIDSTNLVITKDQGSTTNTYYASSGNDLGYRISGTSYTGSAIVGKWDNDVIEGAMRFVNVQESGTITSAIIGFNIVYPNPRTGTVHVRTFGIDEDQTGDFGDGNFSRTETTAYSDADCDNGISSPGLWRFGVTNVVQEILDRGGWQSGYPMGFYLRSNSNSFNAYINASGNYTENYLEITTTDAPSTVYYKYVIFTNKLDSTKAL